MDQSLHIMVRGAIIYVLPCSSHNEMFDNKSTNSDVDESGRKSVFNSRPGTTTKKNSGTISILHVNPPIRD